MKHLKSINKYFLKYSRHLFLGILFVTISNLFGIFPAQITRNALDVVAHNLDTIHLFAGFDLKTDEDHLLSFSILLFGIILIVMAILKGVFMFFMRQMIIVMSRHVEYDQKNEIYAHYQRLGLDFYNQNNTGDLMNRISEDVGRVRMYVGPAIMYTINMLVMFILVIWAMVSVNPKLALFVLMPLPLMSFLVYRVQDKINRKSEAVQSKLSDISTFIQETFSGIRVLKAYSREESFEAAYQKQSSEYRDQSMDLVKVNAMFMPSMLLLVGVSTILTIYIGSLEVMNGRLTIGNIAEFVIYVNMLTWPVASLGWVVTIVQRAAASQERINEFLNTKPHINSGSYKPTTIDASIELKNVTVSYRQSGVKALDNVSFSVPAGSSLGIIGKTGSGKSTLVNTLLRLIDPDKGEVFLDQRNLKEYDLTAFRNRVGCVPQEVFLFSDSINENIAFGLTKEHTQEEIEQAAKDAVVYKNIMEFPEGFNTVVGERGITLSGGQKQRVSIARAIVKRPDLLIFDDCLSAVDTITEEEIL
ncbi:MAG TPA: ABC transporter ATP-binding protein, partial [Bacteroidia bacterium]|nr:ABC transporter ATP-binding protein [Bacteroidia bacterium]